MITSETTGLILSIAGTIIGTVWRLAKLEESQNQKVKDNRQYFDLKLSELRHSLEKLEIQNESDHDRFDYITHALKESMDHKANRLKGQIEKLSDSLGSNNESSHFRDKSSKNRNN